MLKKITEKQKLKKRNKALIHKEMVSLFINIWNKRSHFSEVSGKFLGNEPLTVFFHHILPKRHFEDAMFDENNIILLTFEEHEKVENNPEVFDEVNKRRKDLKRKYGIS